MPESRRWRARVTATFDLVVEVEAGTAEEARAAILAGGWGSAKVSEVDGPSPYEVALLSAPKEAK